MAYFPMFVDISNQDCLVVGGGQVALRKIAYLRDFDARVKVVALNIVSHIHQLYDDDPYVTIEEREFRDTDIDGQTLVIIATDDASFNKETAFKCREAKIPVNVVDCQEECSFILPSYVREENLVAAFSSSGKSPLMTQYLKSEEGQILTPYLGQVNEYLGDYRQYVKDNFPTEAGRKEVFQALLKEAIDTGQLMSDDDTRGFIQGFKDRD